jgi:ubiquinone/menaquinone biosynthesis C-methylase UbiE
MPVLLCEQRDPTLSLMVPPDNNFRAGIGAELLDIGCGFGGSSLFLARTYKARVTGITISPVQVEMAQSRRAAAAQQVDAEFLLMDAEKLTFAKQSELLWSVESPVLKLPARIHAPLAHHQE